MSIGYILCGRVLKAIEIQKCGKKRKIHICWIWVLNMYRNLFGTPHKVSGTKTERFRPAEIHLYKACHNLHVLRGTNEQNTAHDHTQDWTQRL